MKHDTQDPTKRDTIKTGTGDKEVPLDNGVRNPYPHEKTPSKEETETRVKAVADAIKRDDVTVNPDTGRPVNQPAQTDGYQDNLNNPYSTAGKSMGPLHADEVQEKRDGAIKAEQNGNPSGAAELRRQADELEAAQKRNDKSEREEGVNRK